MCLNDVGTDISPLSAASTRKIALVLKNNFGTKAHPPIFALPKRKRLVGQSVKTPPFHGGMRGSIPLRATKPGNCVSSFPVFLCVLCSMQLLYPRCIAIAIFTTNHPVLYVRNLPQLRCFLENDFRFFQNLAW